MNLPELMGEVGALPPNQQQEVVAYLLHLRLQQDTARPPETTRRIDDRTPGDWIGLNDWKKELGEDDHR